MKKIIFTAFGLMMLITLPAKAQQGEDAPLRMTFDDCIEYAIRNNYQRQSIQLNEASQETSLDQARLARLPDLNARLGETFSHTSGSDGKWNGDYSLSTSITISQGGNINKTIQQNRLALEQTQWQTTQYDYDLTVQLLQAFLTVIANEELLSYQQAVLQASEEQFKQGEARFRAGDILESDYLLLQAQLAEAQNSITATRINMDNSLIAVKNLMSMEPYQPLELIYPDTTAIRQMLVLPDADQVVEKGLRTMPQMQISEYGVDIAQTTVDISRSAYFPTLSANAAIGTGHLNNFSGFGSQLSDRFNQQVGLSLAIPIFNHNTTRSQVQRSKIALRQAELEKNQTILNVKQTLLNEYGNVVAAGSKFEMSEVKQEAYLRSFEAYQVMFGAGTITTVELLLQQNNYINAMNEYVQSKYGFILERKILDLYMGVPVTM